jgi:uncharacterized membrane protein
MAKDKYMLTNVKNAYLIAAAKTALFVGILLSVAVAFLSISYLWMWTFNIGYDAAWLLTSLLGIVVFMFNSNLKDARRG